MRGTASFPHLDRFPDNELYDCGCDLVAAATAIREVAGWPQAARAVPAVLGCLEAALRELAEAVAGLEATTAVATAPSGPPSQTDRMHQGYANLRDALEDAERAAAAARPLASRVLAPAERDR